MSISRTYPMPRRVALNVGIALIRWARGTARATSRAPAVAPSTDVAHSSIASAATAPGAALQAAARAKAIRQYHVDRQVERERDQAMRRYLTLPRQP